MKQNLIIRADASSRIGAGHIMRCIALAQAWKDQSGDVTFLSNCESVVLRQRIVDEGFNFISVEKPHPDPSDLTQTLNILKRHAPCSMPHALWFVVDGYHFTPDYQKAIRKNGYSLLVIDDTAHLDHYHADILLNQNIHASSLRYSCDRDTVKLLGCEYILLRREFLKYKDRKLDIPEKAKKILVTMGGGDLDNVTLKVIEALNMLNNLDIEVKIVVGPSNPHKEILKNIMHHAPCTMRLLHSVSDMSEHMAWADVVISAAGCTCWELCFMGLPSLIITVADNQQSIGNYLENEGAAMHLGWFENVTVESIAEQCSTVFYDRIIREGFCEAGRQIISAYGAAEIIASMEGCANVGK